MDGTFYTGNDEKPSLYTSGCRSLHHYINHYRMNSSKDLSFSITYDYRFKIVHLNTSRKRCNFENYTDDFE